MLSKQALNFTSNTLKCRAFLAQLVALAHKHSTGQDTYWKRGEINQIKSKICLLAVTVVHNAVNGKCINMRDAPQRLRTENLL